METSNPNTVSCPACEASSSLQTVQYLDPHWKQENIFDDLKISFCNTCGFGFSLPDLDGETINRFYTSIYRQPGTSSHMNFRSLRRPLKTDYRSFSQLTLAKRFTNFSRGEYFVDVGPGGGASFASAQQVFEKPTLCAIELSDGAAKVYKKIYDAETYESISELRKKGIRPKVILSSHSLEHFRFSDLRDFLGMVRENLAENGIFVAEVPCVDMRVHEKSRFSDSPHFLFFSKESMKKILEKSGFEVVFLETCSQKYDEWLLSHSESKMQHSTSLRKIGTSIFDFLPAPLRQTIQIIYQAFRRQVINFNSEDFAYGGDRTCLRVVARPLKVAHFS